MRKRPKQSKGQRMRYYYRGRRFADDEPVAEAETYIGSDSGLRFLDNYVIDSISSSL